MLYSFLKVAVGISLLLFQFPVLGFRARSYQLSFNVGRLMKRAYRPSAMHIETKSGVVAVETIGWNETFYEDFLQNYWQKRPLLVRRAIPDIINQVDLFEKDFLYLAQDDDVETRLFQQKKGRHTKEYGPFESSRLNKLLKCQYNWTILVQEVDRHFPQIADLWQSNPGFSFIPNWRRDDVMISYSMPGAGIGAHVDNYDVFLLQGMGSREWAIENHYVSDLEENQRRIPNIDTLILKDFKDDQKWILQPGDMLYLPPRIPHRGITVGNSSCVTISLGFRSPNYQNVVTAWWDHASKTTMNKDNSFYTDHDLALSHSASISEVASSRILEGVKSAFFTGLTNGEEYNLWLGKYLTEPLRYHLRKPKPFFIKNSQEMSNNLETEGCTDGSISSNKINSVQQDMVTESDGAEDDDDNNDDDDDDGLEPIYLRSRHRIATTDCFDSIECLFAAINMGKFSLRRCEGIRVAYIEDTLFVNGEAFSSPTSQINSFLCDSNMLSNSRLRELLSQEDSKSFISPLIMKGYFYPVLVKGA